MYFAVSGTLQKKKRKNFSLPLVKNDQHLGVIDKGANWKEIFHVSNKKARVPRLYQQKPGSNVEHVPNLIP